MPGTLFRARQTSVHPPGIGRPGSAGMGVVGTVSMVHPRVVSGWRPAGSSCGAPRHTPDRSGMPAPDVRGRRVPSLASCRPRRRPWPAPGVRQIGPSRRALRGGSCGSPGAGRAAPGGGGIPPGGPWWTLPFLVANVTRSSVTARSGSWRCRPDGCTSPSRPPHGWSAGMASWRRSQDVLTVAIRVASISSGRPGKAPCLSALLTSLC